MIYFTNSIAGLSEFKSYEQYFFEPAKSRFI